MNLFPKYKHNGDFTLPMFEPIDGMTLRDYFAAKCFSSAFTNAHNGDTWIIIAKAAYDMADAMLEARKQ